MLVKNFEGNKIRILEYRDCLFFVGKDITEALGYKNTRDVINRIVGDKYKTRYGNIYNDFVNIKLDPQTVLLNETGLCLLLEHSKKEAVKRFKIWWNNLIKNGVKSSDEEYYDDYITPEEYYGDDNTSEDHTISLKSEYELHTKIVNFIRRFYPRVLINASLGELQDTKNKRIQSWEKGYTAGSADLIIYKKHPQYIGIAIEFKTPQGTGKITQKQEQFLARIKKEGFKTIISNDYDYIIHTLIIYFEEAIY